MPYPETLKIGDHITIENYAHLIEGTVDKTCNDTEGYIYLIEDDGGERLRIRGDLGRITMLNGEEIT